MTVSTDDPELTIYEDLEQGSDDWLQARCEIPTSTTISAMLTPTGKVADNQTSRTAVNNLAAERLTNRPPEPVWSRDIERGHLDEPLAREVYAQGKGAGATAPRRARRRSLDRGARARAAGRMGPRLPRGRCRCGRRARRL